MFSFNLPQMGFPQMGQAIQNPMGNLPTPINPGVGMTPADMIGRFGPETGSMGDQFTPGAAGGAPVKSSFLSKEFHGMAQDPRASGSYFQNKFGVQPGIVSSGQDKLNQFNSF